MHGVQVRAWGARSARTPSDSDPPALLEQLVRTHGRHPAFDRDHASYWNPLAVAWLERALRKGISRRSAICRDLLRREAWDLFFTVFGETHSAGHFFWHLSQKHPLNRWQRASLGDPLRRVFQSVDRAIGEILATRPDADVLLFSPEGMEANSVDLPSTVFLTELLYRFNFGSSAGFGDGRSGVPSPPVFLPRALGWHRELYASRADVTSCAPTTAWLAADGGDRLVGGEERPRAGTPLPHTLRRFVPSAGHVVPTAVARDEMLRVAQHLARLRARERTRSRERGDRSPSGITASSVTSSAASSELFVMPAPATASSRRSSGRASLLWRTTLAYLTPIS